MKKAVKFVKAQKFANFFYCYDNSMPFKSAHTHTHTLCAKNQKRKKTMSMSKKNWVAAVATAFVPFFQPIFWGSKVRAGSFGVKQWIEEEMGERKTCVSANIGRQFAELGMLWKVRPNKAASADVTPPNLRILERLARFLQSNWGFERSNKLLHVAALLAVDFRVWIVAVPTTVFF